MDLSSWRSSWRGWPRRWSGKTAELTYASLIAVMPRAGGDYVWTSRVLGGGIGFVLAVTGWWFILWHWVPIYADLLNKEVFVPLAAILGLDGVAAFFNTVPPDSPGLFLSSMIVAVVASLYISLGMRAYARIQKFCFYGALIGLAAMIVILLFSSQSSFVSAFNRESQELFGAGGNAYQQTVQAGQQALLLLPRGDVQEALDDDHAAGGEQHRTHRFAVVLIRAAAMRSEQKLH